MKNTLVEYTLEQIFLKKRENNIPLLTSDGNEVLGIRLSQELIPGDDFRIINNPRRKIISDRIRSQGKTPYWFQASGIMEGNIAGTDIPIGSTPASFGFKANGLLEYKYLVPLEVYPDDHFELSRVIKEFQFILPFQHFMPKYTREGSEFEVIGKGRGQLTATAGWDYEMGYLKAKAGLGLDVSKEYIFALSIIMLENDFVSVRIDRGVKRFVAVEAGLSIIGETNKLKPAVNTVLAGLDDSLIDVNDFISEIPGLHDFEGLSDLLYKKGVDPLLKTIKAYCKFHFLASSSTIEQRQSVTAFTFAINKQTAYDAYYKLLYLNDSLALQYATEDPLKYGVSVSLSTFNQMIQNTSLRAVLGKKQLLLLQAIHSNQERSFQAGKVLHIERKGMVQRKKHIILIEKEEIIWQDALLQKINTEAIPPTLDEEYQFARMVYTTTDNITRVSEIMEFLLFTQFLGCYKGKSLPSRQQLKGLLKQNNDSIRKVDIYFSDEALKSMSAVNDKTFWKLFAKACNHFDQVENSRQGLPLGDKSVRKEFFKKEQAYELLTTSGWDPSFDLSHDDYEGFPNEYMKRFGRKIRDDAKKYILGKKLQEIITGWDKLDGRQQITWESFIDIKNDKKLFTILGKKFRYNFFLPISLCVSMCKRSEVVISNLELQSDSLHFQCSDASELLIPKDIRFPKNQYAIKIKQD